MVGLAAAVEEETTAIIQTNRAGVSRFLISALLVLAFSLFVAAFTRYYINQDIALCHYAIQRDRRVNVWRSGNHVCERVHIDGVETILDYHDVRLESEAQRSVPGRECYNLVINVHHCHGLANGPEMTRRIRSCTPIVATVAGERREFTAPRSDAIAAAFAFDSMQDYCDKWKEPNIDKIL